MIRRRVEHGLRSAVPSRRGTKSGTRQHLRGTRAVRLDRRGQRATMLPIRLGFYLIRACAPRMRRRVLLTGRII